MEKAKGKAITGILMVTIMVASVFVTAVSMSVTARADANSINADYVIYTGKQALAYNMNNVSGYGVAGEGVFIFKGVKDTLTEGKPPVITPSSISITKLQIAIERAQVHLLEEQKEEGYWIGRIYFNSWATSSYILLTEYMGVVNKTKEGKMVEWLIEHQNQDGSWGLIDEPSVSSMSNTYMALLALEVSGHNHSLAYIKAQNWINLFGDINMTDPYTQLYYAIYDEITWDEVNCPPIEAVLYPDFIYYYNAAWSRDSIMALMTTVTLNKCQNLTHQQLIALNITKSWILTHQLQDGSWYDTILPTQACILALYELNYSVDNPKITSAINFLNEFQDIDDEYARQRRYDLPVWDTELSLIALAESGFNSKDPGMIEACEWLMESQLPSGGFPFNPNNVFCPDVDDTAMAIVALSMTNATEGNNSIQDALTWLINMQNDDGGWGTFDKNQSAKDPGPLPSIYADPTVIGRDPSVSDVVGHVLLALGKMGYNTSDPIVQDAINFLQYDQMENGSWYGRWGLTYTYGTGTVLVGLDAVEENMSEAYVKKAVQWLKLHQNPDGGWGESYLSYYDPTFAGIGVSTPEQTSWTVMGLLAAGEDPMSDSVMNGINYLLSTQREDGGWDSTYTVAALDVYENTNYPNVFPLMALGMYHNYIEQYNFDTGNGTYPSIMGAHNGTITPNKYITVNKMYTYPCSGTGGHSEYVRIWNSSGWNVTARWDGYRGDWHNITFNDSFTLQAGIEYNYTIKTGSYPQIIHKKEFNATGGTITCSEFIDANGKKYNDWIPAIRLEEMDT